MARAALITVHGMGTTQETYADELLAELADRLGPAWQHLHVGTVYYQGILQPSEHRVWQRMGRSVRWDGLRQFLLYGFADAAGLEARKESLASPYTLAQALVARALYLAWQAVGNDGPVVLLAHSLGGQVSSCYFWDAMQAPGGRGARVGIWQDIMAHAPAIAGAGPLNDAAIAFLRGGSLRHVVTTGCNIPIFAAAHASRDILPMRPNDTFRWTNFYDPDDVLGWPLQPLSDAYAKLVQDRRVNAGGGALGWLVKSWNPLSHNQYWRDDEVLDPLTELLQPLLA